MVQETIKGGTEKWRVCSPKAKKGHGCVEKIVRVPATFGMYIQTYYTENIRRNVIGIHLQLVLYYYLFTDYWIFIGQRFIETSTFSIIKLCI